MSRLLRQFLGFILLVSTVSLATCQSMTKAEPVADTEARPPVTWTKS